MATKIKRSLFIGLGGTGMTALLHTKRMFFDTYGEVPPMIGFLGIDTDGDDPIGNDNCALSLRERAHRSDLSPACHMVQAVPQDKSGRREDPARQEQLRVLRAAPQGIFIKLRVPGDRQGL